MDSSNVSVQITHSGECFPTLLASMWPFFGMNTSNMLFEMCCCLESFTTFTTNMRSLASDCHCCCSCEGCLLELLYVIANMWTESISGDGNTTHRTGFLLSNHWLVI